MAICQFAGDVTILSRRLGMRNEVCSSCTGFNSSASRVRVAPFREVSPAKTTSRDSCKASRLLAESLGRPPIRRQHCRSALQEGLHKCKQTGWQVDRPHKRRKSSKLLSDSRSASRVAFKHNLHHPLLESNPPFQNSPQKRSPEARRSVATSAALQAGWNVFLPQQYVYSTELKDLDPQQLSDLWEHTLGERRDPAKCALAMRKSFAFVLVIVKEQHTETSRWKRSKVNPGTRIVGVARAISDGEFMATICDVAVDPDYTGRGIGRKVVQTLVRNMKLTGPTGFAAFPPPKARRFFFMMGFRIDKKYRLMAYIGDGDFPDLRDEHAKLKGARRESQGVTGSQPGYEPPSEAH